MNQNRTIETFLHRSILRYAGYGLLSLAVILTASSFFLAREQASTNLLESAQASVKAFHDRIIDGDIRSVEVQMHELLRLQKNESVKILKADHSKVYSPIGEDKIITSCPVVGQPCFDSAFGQIRLEYPITMDDQDREPFRYLYLSRNVNINWTFLITVISVFLLGYTFLIYSFLRISKTASVKLGTEIESWSKLIKDNPKDANPRNTVPFHELNPLREALEGLNVQIEQFEKTATDNAKMLLMRGIAHDFLTPVGQVQLNVATLQMAPANEEQNELLNDIANSLDTLTRMATQLKTLKEVGSNEKAELVSTLANEVKVLSENEKLTSKNIQLKFDPQTRKANSPFSKTDVSRILTNLVENAVHASKDGDTIKVSVCADEKFGTFIVEDYGKGIPNFAKDKVFDPDFTMKPGTGTGLGLTIVKHLCDHRKAKIELKSELNKGTKISIQFPISEVAHV